VRFSPAQVQAGYAVTVAAAYVCIVAEVVAGVTPVWTLLALVTLPLAWRVRNGLRANYGDPYALMPTMQSNILLHLLTGLLLVIGYVIAVVS
jgi:1,4-dihydroxy-2-naphthoate octaprenyltransferase